MKKRISIISCLSAVLLIAIAVVVMVLVPVNYKPEINNPNQIKIYNSTSQSVLYVSENEKYTEFMDLFGKSFTRDFLSALFAGQVNSNALVPEIVGSSLPTFTSYKVEFTYNDAQTLTANGETYSKVYNSLVFGVSNNNTFAKTNIYFKQTYKAADATYYTYYNLSTFADMGALFDMLEGIEDFSA